MQHKQTPPPEDRRTAKRKLGDLGEHLACEYLIKHGFEILDRNYLRKWGELDIVAKRKGVIRFIEVKSVSCVTLSAIVTHATPKSKDSQYRPEDNMHPWKLKRLTKAMQTYLLEKRLDNIDWQLDVVTVKIDETKRMARIELIENIII